MAKNPKTLAEWQDAADMAEFFVCLDSARLYGLVAGGPEVDVDRCLEVLDEAKRRGIRPRPNCVQRITEAMLRDQQAKGT